MNCVEDLEALLGFVHFMAAVAAVASPSASVVVPQAMADKQCPTWTMRMSHGRSCSTIL